MNDVLGALRRFELAQSAAFHRASEYLGVSETVLGTLRTLLARDGDDGISMKDLALEVGVTPAVLTGVIDRLEENGWARRELSPTDRRSTVVIATADEEDDVCILLKALDDPLQAVAKDLADGDADMVKRLAHAMEAEARRFDPATVLRSHE